MATRRNNRKWIWCGAGIFVVILAAIGIVMVKNKVFDGGTRDERGQSEVEPSSKETDKKEMEGSDSESETGSGAQKKEVEKYDGGDPNQADELTGVISYARVYDGYLIVRVNIDQYLSSGSCELSVGSMGGAFYSEVVPIVSSVSTSTCDGFKVPLSKLSGYNIIRVFLESDGRRGEITGGIST